MTRQDTKTIGRGAACDLVLDDPSVSTLHARLALSDDGYLYVEDAGSHHGTWLRRDGRQARALRATVCVGDEIRFGDIAVTTDRLARLFAHDRRLRLRARPAFRAPGPDKASGEAGATGTSPHRRNPETGLPEATMDKNIPL